MVISLGAACENHDRCYGTCGKAKQECDDQFYNDAMRECNSYPGWSFGKTRQDCMRFAGIYHAAIANNQDAYKNAQKEACDCKKKK